MSSLSDIFRKINIMLYQNESLDLDHYYQEPYQDNNDNIDDMFDMSEPFEKDQSRKTRHLGFSRSESSNFSFFMDGSRRTYKIGDIVLEGKRIYPVVVAQVSAGCTERHSNKKLSKYILKQKKLLLISGAINDGDFDDIRLRIEKSELAKSMNLEVVKFKFDKQKDILPVNAAIGKANSVMHSMEIDILNEMVKSSILKPNKMLIVDGPLQFIAQDTGKPSFADLFYNVVGVSKSFDPMLPISEKTKRGGTQIGTQLLKLEYGDRTPVFYKRNSKGRIFGCWYLRIRPRENVYNPLEGVIKVEKMAIYEECENGMDTDTVDNLSLSLLEECSPTCHGKDDRWASHLYPIYLTETMIKSSFMSDLSFVNHFKKNFK